MTYPTGDRPLGAELRPLMLGAVFLRRWRWTVLFPALVVLLTIVLVFVVPSRYTSEAIVLPESRTATAQGGAAGAALGGLAGLAGLAAGGGAQSPKLYADLVIAEVTLDAVLARRVTSVEHGGAQGPTLLEWLDVSGKSHDDSLYNARRYLLRRVTTDVNRETGTVTLRVALNQPRVSTEVAGWFVEELDQFNTMRRQTSGRNRRMFLENRLAELEKEQRGVSDSLRAFYEANRQYQDAPVLLFEARRRQARLDQISEVLNNVRRDYENARTDEVNDTPLLTIVEPPTLPVRRSFPQRKLLVLLAGVSSLLVGMAMAYFGEALRQWNRTDTEGRADMEAAWAEARRGLGRVLPLRSRDGSGGGGGG
jgi:capsule polysaccharide export protein KpsE/RkpR